MPFVAAMLKIVLCNAEKGQTVCAINSFVKHTGRSDCMCYK
jgi:hypothetical protein